MPSDLSTFPCLACSNPFPSSTNHLTSPTHHLLSLSLINSAAFNLPISSLSCSGTGISTCLLAYTVYTFTLSANHWTVPTTSVDFGFFPCCLVLTPAWQKTFLKHFLRISISSRNQWGWDWEPQTKWDLKDGLMHCLFQSLHGICEEYWKLPALSFLQGVHQWRKNNYDLLKHCI